MITEVRESGSKVDFSKFKKGDIVVICGTSYGVSNSNYKYPNRANFQLSKIEEVGEDYIQVEGGFKFIQAISDTFYYDLLNGGRVKEITYTNDYLKIKRANDKSIPSIDNKRYNTNYGEIYNDSVYNPRYLFVYTKEWENKIEDCKRRIKEREEADLKRKQEEQKIIDMKKESKDQYDAVIDPLVEKLEKLKEKIEQERKKAFDEFFCKKCKNNGTYCKYERKWHDSYNCHLSDIDTEKHIDKNDGYRTRPIIDCEFFEKD